ncbi:hypothetical protein KR074_003092, partial [Drosophila pseudoananassae]
IEELPEEVRVVETISEDGKPKKKKIRTRVIKKIKGDKQEVTKIETIEEDDKAPETTVTVEESEAGPVVQEVIEELPEEVRVVETISEDGKPKKKKIRTRVIKKITGDKQEVTKIETVEEDDKSPETTVTVEESEAEPVVQEAIEELPEEVRIVETISEDGKLKKKKIRARVIKKIKGDKQEVTKIETVEEDDKAPETTVTVEKTDKVKQPISEYTIRIEELAPETTTETVTNEDGKEVERTTTRRKIKKKEGPREYLIEVVETYEENKPESDIVIQTTEVTPTKDTEVLDDHKVKIVKKKKPKEESLDDFVYELIEQEISEPDLKEQEPTISESSTETKKPKKVKKHHKKITEIVDGVPTTVHEVTVKEFEIDQEDVKPFEVEVEEIDRTQITESPEDQQVTVVEQKPKPKTKKSFKPKIVEEEQPQPILEDIEESVETITVVEEDGVPKQVEVKKKRVSRKQGPKEQIFEITETKSSDEPLAEVTIVEITEETPKEEVPKTKPKKLVRKPVALKPEEVDSYIVNVLEEFRKPESSDEADQPVVEDIGETVEIVKVTDEEGTTKKVEVKKKKIARKQGPKEQVFEITETKSSDEPLAEVTIVEVTEETPKEVVPKTKPKKLVKKPVALKPEEVDSYIVNVLEEFRKPGSSDEAEQPVVEDIGETVEIGKVTDEEGTTKKVEVKKKKIARKQGPKEQVFEITETKSSDEPLSEVTIVEVTEETPKEVVPKTKPKKLVKKPVALKPEEVDSYIVNVLEEFRKPESSDEADQPVVEDIGETVEIVKVTDKEGSTKKVEVKKKKVARKQGPKEQVFEITETKSSDEPLSEVTIVEIEEDQPQEEILQPKEKKPIRKPKKLKPEDVQEYIVNVLEEFSEPQPFEAEEDVTPAVIEETKEIKEKTSKPKKATKKPVEEKIVIEEMAPETIIENIVDEQGEEVKQVKTIKKLKKKEGPKEFLIEVTETYQENKPEVIIELTKTELGDEALEQPDLTEEKFNKLKTKKVVKKVKKREVEDCVKQLIEEETVPESPKPTKTKRIKPKTVVTDEQVPDEPTETPSQVAQPESTAQITPSAQDETKDTIQKTIKHKKTKPDTHKSVEKSKSKDESLGARDFLPPMQYILLPIRELPEDVRVVETITEDGKPKKKKIRTRVIKKVKGDKEEVTKIETVEEDDKEPETTVTIEESEIKAPNAEKVKLKKRVIVQKPEDEVTVVELPERKSVILSEKEDGTPTKTVIKTRIIKKIKGQDMEVTKVQTIEEYEKEPQTKVTVENFKVPFPDLPEEKVTEVVVLPDEVVETEVVDDTGVPKVVKTKKRVIKKPVPDNIEEITEIGIIEQPDSEPIYSVSIKEQPATESKVDESNSVELPEQVTEFEIISPDGTKKKKTVRSRAFKKNLDDKLDEVTTVQIIEEEDKEPTTTVQVEVVPVDEISITPIPIDELPEETIFTEELDHNKKPKKKTTKTRTFKKQGPEDEEYFQIQTVEEEGKEPYSLIRV